MLLRLSCLIHWTIGSFLDSPRSASPLVSSAQPSAQGFVVPPGHHRFQMDSSVSSAAIFKAALGCLQHNFLAFFEPSERFLP